MDDSTPPTKTCERCGATLPPPARASGRRRRFCSGVCCDAAYRVAHAEEARAYRAAHREETRTYDAAYNAAHREEQRAQQAVYRAAHREEKRARDAAYYAAHREEARAWVAAHREEKRAWVRNRYARLAAAAGTHTAADVAAQYERQHGRCYWCGEKVGKAYHVDHVIPLSKGGGNGPENIVVTCPTCNLKKNARHPMDFAGVLC